MTCNDNQDLPDTAFFVSLENGVWDALVSGDPVADGAMLTDDFLGVYPSGFATRADHMQQLSKGPAMQSYELSDVRLLPVGSGQALLCYRAQYQRFGSDLTETMFITSLWKQCDGRWLNSFSQDTPAA